MCLLRGILVVSPHEAVNGSAVSVGDQCIDIVPEIALGADTGRDRPFITATLGMLDHRVKGTALDVMGIAEANFELLQGLDFFLDKESNLLLIFAADTEGSRFSRAAITACRIRCRVW